MRDVSGLEAHACSVGNMSRRTGDRQRRFPNPRMRHRHSLPLLLSLAALLAFGGFASSAAAAELLPAPAQKVEKHEAVPLKAAPLFRIGRFIVTNSMLVTWIVAAGIIVFAQTATRNIMQIPTGAQNFWEWLVEGLYNFLESVIGSHLVRKTFWFFATIFIFILFLNWFGLIPGVGTIGWGHVDPATNSFHVDRPLLRGANADLNLTFAMAAVFFALWIVWALQENGVGGFIMHLFGPKGESKGVLKILMIIVFFMVGWLEIVSILFRPISLSFRLYGNVYAGENMLESMAHLVPSLSWLIPIPFYFMELLVGVVQALVFMLLTAVFTLLIAQHEPAQGAHH
ncbi:MAG TPA: F0F1 ATP synthase subunit A [Chthoniobacterales bacterium]|jgi:F-type H+-transporting ATPase subunit a